MASAAPQRSKGHRSYRQQKRFVPKIDNVSSPSSSSASSSSRDHAASDNPNPPAVLPLTTSLRGSSTSVSRTTASKGYRAVEGSFVNYLPHDEAVAGGLGADYGGIDAEESQAVVDLLNGELSRVLKLSPRDFWREVARNDSLLEFLDSYLQFRNRWYDFVHRGPVETVAGLIVGEIELCRRVFMVLYRISSNKDPTGMFTDSLSMKEHTALLQEKKLLDFPKLLDICAIYGHDNKELTTLLVANAIKAQPNFLENINVAVSHFLNIVHTMHQRCSSSVEVLISSGDHGDQGQGQLFKDFLEVMDFINDAVVTLDAFADAYKPAALYFSLEMSSGNEDLLNTLARLHDLLLPSVQQGLALVSNTIVHEAQSSTMIPNIATSLKVLSMRIVKLGWKLLEFCYLNDELTEDSIIGTSTKMFPAKVEDPAIRGDILVQALKEINGDVPYQLQENLNGGTFIQNIEKNYNILSQIGSLRSKGWIFMDEDHFHYLAQIATPPHFMSWGKEPVVPIPSLNQVQINEDAVISESKISQIKDLFPDYGKGFLSACLEVYNQNPEEVIQRILEGTLHEDLLSLDTSLDHILPPKSASHSKKDKGKGILLEPPSQKITEAIAPSQKITEATAPSQKITEATAPLSTSSSSSFGRFTRKSKEDLPDSIVLDSSVAKDAIRSMVLSAENEYEDEYDDSFDDLGFNVVEPGFEDMEETRERTGSLSENPSGPDTKVPKWGSQRKPQFYVKDGKNYSYKVSGSIGVANAQDAAVINQAQREMIHGLGRGGNLPLGAVKMMSDAEKQENEGSNAAVSSGRGSSNPRGRGGRRGGGDNYRKDRAMRKHFSGLGGY